jgi:hypothetical protein
MTKPRKHALAPCVLNWPIRGEALAYAAQSRGYSESFREQAVQRSTFVARLPAREFFNRGLPSAAPPQPKF